MLPHAKFVSMMPSFRAYSAACAKNVFSNSNNSAINFTQQSPNNKKNQNIIRHRLETNNKPMTGACYYSTLSGKKCIPCEGGVLPLDLEKANQLLKELHADWRLVDDGKKLRRDYVMKDFNSGLDFFRDIGVIAEEEGHHPDLHLTGYRDATVEIFTHSIGGLTENDFIIAAKIDQLKPQLKDW